MTNITYPQTLFIRGDEFIAAFKQCVGNINKQDLSELITQIFMIFLNQKDPNIARIALRQLPEFNRMPTLPFGEHTPEGQRFKEATFQLGDAILNHLLELGAYRENGFDYGFVRWLNNDFMLEHFQF